MASTVDISNLFPALFNCFFLILLGYIAGRMKLLTPTQYNGIGNFVGAFALPSILFLNMVELDFSTVTWSFLYAIFLAKFTVFLVVILLTVILLGRNCFGKAGLYSIFATQSNDIAMGYPIAVALYKDSYPELIQYIYLVAPIQLLVLNPLGFLFMEIDKDQKRNEINDPTASISSEDESSDNSRWQVVWRVLRGLLTNPIVGMVFLGIICHFIFNGKLPALLDEVFTTLANSFSATALFFLGLSTVGKLKNQSGSSILTASGLIVAKVLLLPTLCRGFMLLLADHIDIVDPNQPHSNVTNSSTLNAESSQNQTYAGLLADYSFLYGAIPTAPSVAIYASRYGFEVDMIATSMVACTALSAPIMFISAWCLTYSTMTAEKFIDAVISTDIDVTIVAVVCAAWCIFVFVSTQKFKRPPFYVTFALTLSMFSLALTSVLDITYVKTESPAYAQIIASTALSFTEKNTRLLTASLALFMVSIEHYGVEKTWEKRSLFILPAIFVSLTLAIIVGSVLGVDGAVASFLPVWKHNTAHDLVALSVDLTVLVVTFVCLLILFRTRGFFSDASSPSNTSYDTTSTHDCPPHDESSDDDLLESGGLIGSSDSVSDTSSLLQDPLLHKYPLKKIRHVVLLSLLCISNFLDAVLTVWRLLSVDMSGVYIEMAFIDTIFDVGQAFFVFVIFGFDDVWFVHFVINAVGKVFRRKQVQLPSLRDVDISTKNRGRQFLKHHMHDCKDALPHGDNIKPGMFKGSDLCSWLVDVGLADTRDEAEDYGNSLITGRIIHHETKQQLFYDSDYLYKFNTEEYIAATGLYNKNDLVLLSTLPSSTSHSSPPPSIMEQDRISTTSTASSSTDRGIVNPGYHSVN